MHIAVRPLKEIYGVNEYMLNFAFTALDEPTARKQNGEASNSLLWLVGHVVSCRFWITGIAKQQELPQPWEGIFDKSIDKVDHAKFPSLAEVRKLWEELKPQLHTALETLDEATILKDLPDGFPNGKSMLSGLAFMAMHESYHVGQISSLRKAMGMESLYSQAVKDYKSKQAAAQA